MWNLIAFRQLLMLFWEGCVISNLKLFIFSPVCPEYLGPLPWLRLVVWSSAISGCWFYCCTSTGGVPFPLCFRCMCTHYTSQLVLRFNTIKALTHQPDYRSSDSLANSVTWDSLVRCVCCATSRHQRRLSSFPPIAHVKLDRQSEWCVRALRAHTRLRSEALLSL